MCGCMTCGRICRSLGADPLMRSHFEPFETCYGKNANGESNRTDQGEEGRFRCLAEFVAERART